MTASYFPDPEQIEEEEIDEEEQTLEDETQVQNSCAHSYAFVEPLPSDEQGIHKEKWRCLDCSDERELRIHTAACDY